MGPLWVLAQSKVIVDVGPLSDTCFTISGSLRVEQDNDTLQRYSHSGELVATKDSKFGDSVPLSIAMRGLMLGTCAAGC